jgi:hypothetical protein
MLPKNPVKQENTEQGRKDFHGPDDAPPDTHREETADGMVRSGELKPLIGVVKLSSFRFKRTSQNNVETSQYLTARCQLLAHIAG